ncbi:MAG: hypothetical protein B7Z66_05875 [Chromatiales bacterium 21-64-14]|nr:MAG: hypothetical protein B7Z66_05875 [Chromatiales bacterium 21-64-14]HQU15168.1 DNA-J related domain-containing protein [Gammaproteobacteria bacterium]
MDAPTVLETQILDRLQEVLEAHPAGLSEYLLFKRLKEEGSPPFAAASFDSSVGLYAAHFLLFHWLYRLQDRRCRERRGGLEIHCLKIRLLPFRSAAGGLPAPHDSLRDYYLDLEHLRGITPGDVDRLLNQFWARFRNRDRCHDALKVLGLEAGACARDIQRRYRRLAMKHHPDRGGDTARFQEIHAAMQVLAGRRG